MNSNFAKKVGRRAAGSWGRVKTVKLKRAAAKAVRKARKEEESK